MASKSFWDFTILFHIITIFIQFGTSYPSYRSHFKSVPVTSSPITVNTMKTQDNDELDHIIKVQVIPTEIPNTIEQVLSTEVPNMVKTITTESPPPSNDPAQLDPVQGTILKLLETELPHIKKALKSKTIGRLYLSKCLSGLFLQYTPEEVVQALNKIQTSLEHLTTNFVKKEDIFATSFKETVERSISEEKRLHVYEFVHKEINRFVKRTIKMRKFVDHLKKFRWLYLMFSFLMVFYVFLWGCSCMIDFLSGCLSCATNDCTDFTSFVPFLNSGSRALFAAVCRNEIGTKKYYQTMTALTHPCN